VANEWRNTCVVPGLMISALRMAFFSARCKVLARVQN